MIVSVLWLFVAGALAQSAFAPGDWQSWRDFRGARALDASAHELFVATGGGVLTYQISRGRWDDPAAMGHGSFEAIPIDDALLLIYDQRYDNLWVATRDRLLKWQYGLNRWEIAARGVWTFGERPVNIGFDEHSLYVETMPDHVFETLFSERPPLPGPNWMSIVRRYKGDLQSGNMLLDLAPDVADPERVIWRGLRSKVLIEDAQYPPGIMGRLPAGLPYVFPPKPYSWLNDGTLLDPSGRPFPITDWLLDRWSNFWSTHWGAGVLKVDLRSQRSDQLLAGPAGNDIRALLFLERELWMGGANDEEYMGISVFEGYGTGWRFYERRDDSQIRSTQIEDLAFAGEQVWLATADGLLSYFPRKKLWKRYDVQDNLQAQQITALASQGNRLWIGTVDGLSVMQVDVGSITQIPADGFALSGVRDIALLDSFLYVGTEGGLTQVNSRTHEVTRLPLDPGLVNTAVLGLSAYGHDLWLVTAQGLMRWAGSGETTSWLAAVHMKSALPTCVEASDPYVWVGTETGFWRFDPERNTWDSYSRKDGLVDDHVHVIREDRGDLWLGTAGGLTRYYWSRPGASR
ncbi:MAG: hypothetical protein IPG71_00865 [bacterium]|nr:hypothetical protein [bacterium]